MFFPPIKNVPSETEIYGAFTGSAANTQLSMDFSVGALRFWSNYLWEGWENHQTVAGKMLPALATRMICLKNGVKMVLSMDSIGYQDWDCVFLLYVVPFMFCSLFSTHPRPLCSCVQPVLPNMDLTIWNYQHYYHGYVLKIHSIDIIITMISPCCAWI